MRSSRIGATLRVAGINLAILLALALAAEALFGEWFSADPLSRIALPRDQAVTISAGHLYPGGRDFVYRRDRWGLRGQGTDPREYAILTLGGSTTNQLYLDEPETWQAALERSLAEKGKPARVANAGIDGQSTVGHVVNLERWFPNVPGLKPKIVLAYVGINDVHVTGSSIDRLEHSSLSKMLRERSALVRLQRTIVGMFSARRAKLNHHRLDFEHAEWTETGNFGDLAVAGINADPDGYRARLVRIVELVRGMGALPVLVTQARGDSRIVDGRLVGMVSANGPNGVDWHRLLARFNAVTLEVCGQTGAVCLDLAGEIAFAEGDFYDHVHNTPQGAAKVGRWLAEKLAPLL